MKTHDGPKHRGTPKPLILVALLLLNGAAGFARDGAKADAPARPEKSGVVKSDAATSSAARPPLELFGTNMAAFFPHQPPKPGNAAEHYFKAYKIWRAKMKTLDRKTRNSPPTLEQIPEIVQAVDLIEKGAEFAACDFYEFIPFSPSAYFQERPDSIGVLLQTKLLIRRSDRALAAGRAEEAVRLSQCCVAYGTHLYITAENHTQATIAMQILTASFTLMRNALAPLKNYTESRRAIQQANKFRELFDQHATLGAGLRHGVPYDLDSVLAALASPLPAVRCEALRTLGNVVDPNVKPAYVLDPKYNTLRQSVREKRPNLIAMLDAMASLDRDPRVVRLARAIGDLMRKPNAPRPTRPPLLPQVDDMPTTHTIGGGEAIPKPREPEK